MGGHDISAVLAVLGLAMNAGAMVYALKHVTATVEKLTAAVSELSNRVSRLEGLEEAHHDR